MIEAIHEAVSDVLDTPVAAPDPRRRVLTEEEKDRVWRLMCAEVDDKPHLDDLDAFIDVVERTGLDPFSRQVTPFARRDKGRQRIFPLITIDGSRLIGQRTGEFAGRVGPFWCGEDGEWRDVWLSDKPPVAAKVGLRRIGHLEPTFSVALWRESGGSTPIWKKMPAHMLAKVAEANSWRVLFPAELSGIYTVDEFAAQADDERGAAAPAPTSRRQRIEETKAQLRAEAAAKGPHEHWPTEPLDDDPFADDPQLQAKPAPTPTPVADTAAIKKAMFRANDRAIETLAGETADDAVKTGLRWALMTMAAVRAAAALGLKVTVRTPEAPLHKHALALARKVDREYDGNVVDVTGLTAAELARLAEGMGVRLEVTA